MFGPSDGWDLLTPDQQREIESDDCNCDWWSGAICPSCEDRRNRGIGHQPVVWVAVTPDFGVRMKHGSCNAQVGDAVCGFPRREDGTCTRTNPHPAPPGWK